MRSNSTYQTNDFKQYLLSIGKYKLLTADEQFALGHRIQRGQSDDATEEEKRDGEKALNDLIVHNLRLVVNIAKGYKNYGVDIRDLVEEGNIGLIEAAKRFDPSKECRFSTHATFWIKQAILKALTDGSRTIRVPAHIYQALNQMQKAQGELEDEGIIPTDEALAKKMGKTAEFIANLKVWQPKMISLDMPLGDTTNDDTFGDLQADESDEGPVEYTDKSEIHDRLSAAIHRLDERTQKIIKLRYGFWEEGDPLEFKKAHTLEEISPFVNNLTRERIRQIEKKAIADLKNYLKQ